MSAHRSVARRLAQVLAGHAIAVSPPERTEWARAMANEIDQLPTGLSAVRWACGCVLVGYSERILCMTRATSPVSRWIMGLEMLVCFVPLTFLLCAVLFSAARGSIPWPHALLYGSLALTGPCGLILGLRIAVFTARAASRVTIALLAILAGWTLLAYSGQVLSNGGIARLSEWWRDFVLIALLPALAVVHLARMRFGHPRGNA